MTEGLIDTIQAFITNPTRPELALAAILNLVKELGIQALDITEDLIMAIIDGIVAAIHLLKQVLNAEIRIPLISALLELIGAGNLSIINVMTILVAIPTTVVSKLMFGEHPFAGLDVPQLAEPKDKPAETAALVQRNLITTRKEMRTNQKAQLAERIAQFEQEIEGLEKRD